MSQASLYLRYLYRKREWELRISKIKSFDKKKRFEIIIFFFYDCRSYNEVLEYYKKSERAYLKGFEKSSYRNQDGELPVEFVPVR